MKKRLITLLLVCATMIPSMAVAQNADKRIDQSIERANSMILKQMPKLTTDQLPAFYKVWSEASAQHAKTQQDKVCDDVVRLIFEEYARKQKTYLILPPYINVTVCNHKLNVSPDAREAYDAYDEYRKLNKNAAYSYKYIPHVASDRKILYSFDAANKLIDSCIMDVEKVQKIGILLESYIEEKEKERISIIKERRSTIQKDINIYHGRYGWRSDDYPSIDGITIFTNGICVDFRSDREAGLIVFIPKGTEKFIGIFWIEDDLVLDELEF